MFEGAEVIGYNTDYNAAMDCLEYTLGDIGANPSPLTGKQVLVLGAGGVARPIVFGLRKRGARRRSPRERWPARSSWPRCSRPRPSTGRCGTAATVDILINCTPVGMHPNVDESPIHKTFLKPSMLVFDTVYNPENTLLVKDARSRNCTVITGVEMFVRQAMLQFFLFTRKEAPADLMRDVLKRAIGPVKYYAAADAARTMSRRRSRAAD